MAYAISSLLESPNFIDITLNKQDQNDETVKTE